MGRARTRPSYGRKGSRVGRAPTLLVFGSFYAPLVDVSNIFQYVSANLILAVLLKFSCNVENASNLDCFDVEETVVSPTVFRERGYRFFFFSREEERMHVHVNNSDGEAKFWLEPSIELAKNYGLSPTQLTKIREIVAIHESELINAWHAHFGN